MLCQKKIAIDLTRCKIETFFFFQALFQSNWKWCNFLTEHDFYVRVLVDLSFKFTKVLNGCVSHFFPIQSWVERAEKQALLSDTLDLSELFHPDTFLNALRQETAR